MINIVCDYVRGIKYIKKIMQYYYFPNYEPFLYVFVENILIPYRQAFGKAGFYYQNRQIQEYLIEFCV